MRNKRYEIELNDNVYYLYMHGELIGVYKHKSSCYRKMKQIDKEY